jgi:hypothetical protein
MKKISTLIILLLLTTLNAQVTISPAVFNVNDPITITVNLAQTGCNTIPTSATKIYMHSGIGDDTNPFGFSVIGTWGQDNGIGQMTNQGGGIWSITITPSTYFGLNTTQQTNATKLGIVIRNATGTQELKKTPSCSDYIFNVGTFQANLITPTTNSTSIINSGGSLSISANNTGGTATYVLKSNGSVINTANNVSSYTFNHTNISANQSYELEITRSGATITRKFSLIVNPTSINQALPAGLVDGINYNPTDFTKATLVLNAPFKDFIYVAGSFNNYNPTAAFAMRKDPTSGKFWLELSNLIANQIYTYQYWVCDQTNLPVNSPALVKTADPFSTLVLSPFDDPEIATLGVFPNLPAYPTGQEREVTVLQTGDSTLFTYNWSAATTNFVKPNKKDLVFYEILLRDFDADRTFQNVINKIDYFKNLKINAIKIMPVMEFEGNLSWGYNTAFHMALDKRYGTPKKLKELVDLCHQNGIAVVLDLALNHVFGRSPLERMWMLDADNDGWANSNGFRVTTENPYVNRDAMHSYNVGSDLNHFNDPNNLTTTYSLRTIQYWINEFKIDGYRWDLTKGFTNMCPPNVSGGQENCTNGYRVDRVAKMKYYADQQWLADPNSYVIFEHLGTNGGSGAEEVEWANYINTGNSGGIMQWRKMTDPYAELLKGNATDLSGVTHPSNRFIGYAESHDEERVVYKAFTEAGQTQGNLSKIFKRLQAMGAVHLLVPGPKMIWHFGSLGWDESIFLCSNGTVQINDGCKLDTKPQPQWTENWLQDPERLAVYNSWAKMIDIRKNENVFENGQFTWNFSQVGRPRLDVWTSTSPSTDLAYVFVLTNFSDQTYTVAGGFPYTGNWYNLMDNSLVSVSTTSQNISIEPGGFRVFGNKEALLSSNFIPFENSFVIYPNPVNDAFALTIETKAIDIYNIAGQLVKSFQKNTSNSFLNVSDLQNGVYLMKITDDNNNQATKKFIKQ